jgi:hypothetical protein
MDWGGGEPLTPDWGTKGGAGAGFGQPAGVDAVRNRLNAGLAT